MDVPTSHQPRPCIIPKFPKMGFSCQNFWPFSGNFDLKPLKVC